MKEKVLYVYGYGSSPSGSSTFKEVKEVMNELGYELVSVQYDQRDPIKGLGELEEFIKDNDIKKIIGHSLGGFMTLCINEDVKKIVINPCMIPSEELKKLSEFGEDSYKKYKYLERWIESGNEQPWSWMVEDVMGIFGKNDELFSYYDSFKLLHPRTYMIDSGHRPKQDDFTKELKEKIKEFFS